ncbi:VanZ family protein [bacterium]|nr:VanZ family protein [bacterium]
MRRKKYIFALWIIYSVVVFALSATPRTAIRSEIPYFDKLTHCGAFAVFAVLSLFSLAGIARRNLKVFLLAGTYGAAIEMVQYFVPGRQASFWDWSADIVGALLGILLIAWWERRRKLAR